MPSKLTTKEFINKAKQIHGNKYDYSLVDYKNNKTKVKIICSKHGIFEQVASNHMNGSICPICANRVQYTTKEFIEKAKQIHGNKYDYSLVVYKGNKGKVKIICPEHGIFEQTPNNHLSKKVECPKCKNTKYTTEEFVEKAKQIHGEKYDYSLVNYKNIKTKIKIICPKHGIFEQFPVHHIRGTKCAKCANSNLYMTTNDFIKEVKKIHGEKYDYSLVDYKGYISKIKIICIKHGMFEQDTYSHLHGSGCPKCKESQGETKVRLFLEKKNINYIQEYKFKNCVSKESLRFDFYLPTENILIEYDGEQHFKAMNYFGGIEAFNRLKIRDEIKNQYCIDNDIQLIRIKYDESVEDRLNESNL